MTHIIGDRKNMFSSDHGGVQFITPPPVAAVVPPFGMASAEAEENAGKALYEHFAFYPNEQKPAWTPCGNAIRQDDARRLAMCAVDAWLAASPFRSKQ